MTFRNTRAPQGHRICRHLRCKEMYYTEVLPQPTGPMAPKPIIDVEDDFHVYWCVRTCMQRGPEGAPLNLDACGPARPCYE